MTRDLDALKSALTSAAPAPDPHARARDIALAMENFDRLQAAAAPARPSEDRPHRAGFLNRVRQIMQNLSSRPFLAASTSVAALVIGVAILLPVTEALRPTGLPPAPPPPADALAEAPAAASSVADAATAPPAAAAKVADTGKTVTDAETGAANGAEGGEALPGLLTEEAALPDDRARIAADAPEPVVAAAPAPDLAPQPLPDTEAYPKASPNPVKVTAEEPVSTFSTDVDTASYALVRSTLNAGQLPGPDQVRVEEMVNYFPYAYPAPPEGQAFVSTVSVQPTPWNDGTRLVTIGIQGALPAVADRPPLNLVFLIDTSGSMEDPAKLPLLRQSLALMLGDLRAEDQIAIVAYAGSAGLVLEPTAAVDSARILAALDALSAGGATAGAEGIDLAYRTAAAMADAGEVSRVILATDGDFNVGISDPAALTGFIAARRDEGIYLSVLGFGRGNLDDATMQALAQNGNGTAAHIDTLSEARKVLVDQLTGALFPIADDVKVQVEWNPATVAEYRLIGYETRAMRREDFNNDAVDAGDIGAGLQVTAIYEVTAPGSDALLNDPLRYGTAAAAAAAPEGAASELGFLRLRWKAPGETDSRLIETPITGAEPATAEARFAAAIAGFGQLLQGSPYLGDWGWDQAIALALSARGEDPFGYRIEAVNLMRLAQALDG